MADSYTFSNGSMSSGNDNMPSGLQGYNYLNDDIFNSAGLYSRQQIEDGRFNKYPRYARIIDPYGRLNDTRELLFFVKPDLHILKVPNEGVYQIGGMENEDSYTANGMTLNPQLDGNAYFMDLIDRHPQVINELQYSASTNINNDPFSHLLSFSVTSNLDLPSSESTTIETASTMFGTHLEYLKDSEASDENPSFSLEFQDTKYLDVYHFFKAYAEYHNARKSGLVTPPSMDYYKYRKLHNTMGIYKFLLSEDMETIIYYAYFWGVFPTSVPREAFSEPTFPDGLTFSISFKAAFMEDMNPNILWQFNKLMRPLVSDPNDFLPVIYQNRTVDTGSTNTFKENLDGIAAGDVAIMNDRNSMSTAAKYHNTTTSRINGTLPRAALVDAGRVGNEKRLKYRLRWYA